MIRVVFDTNILYSAILQPKGLPAKAVDMVVSGLRPELDIHEGRRRQMLDLFTSVALYVTPTDALNVSADEDENRIYECADAAMADYIVTGNARHFAKAYKRTRIVTARQFVELLAGGSQV